MAKNERKISCLIFDLVGTLYKSKSLSRRYDAKIFRLIAEIKEIEANDAENLISNTREDLKRKLGYRPPLITTLEELSVKRGRIYKAIEEVNPFNYLNFSEKLRKLMSNLAKDYSLCILTNTSSRQARRTLRALGIEPQKFELVLGGDKVEKIKPNKEPFTKISKSLDEEPSLCVSVGDREHIDLKPAKELGMKTILISEKKVESQYADVIIPDIHKIEKVISKTR